MSCHNELDSNSVEYSLGIELECIQNCLPYWQRFALSECFQLTDLSLNFRQHLPTAYLVTI